MKTIFPYTQHEYDIAYTISHESVLLQIDTTYTINQCFSTAEPRPGTGPWHQLYWATRAAPGICHFSLLSIFHE